MPVDRGGIGSAGASGWRRGSHYRRHRHRLRHRHATATAIADAARK